jgi:DNA-directed RNA polymerase subunit RPC12/RpoP
VRLNSNGVRALLRYFDSVRERGTKVVLTECSPAVVDKFNSFINFSCGAQIESIYVPYHCTGCKRELMGLFSMGELKRSGLKMPGLKCPSCGMHAEFDDLPDEYFRFVEREMPELAVSRQTVAKVSNLQEPSLMTQRPAREDATGILRRIAT